MKLRLLAFAAATGRVASVLFVNGALMEWQISDKAARSPQRVSRWMKQQFDDWQPDVVVTEDIALSKTKGNAARSVTEAVMRLAAETGKLNPRIRRRQSYANKYEEAAAIAQLFPELLPWVPKRRRFFDNEPRNTVLFEAMAHALVVLRDPPQKLGEAMG